MKINKQKTNARFKEMCINRSAWALKHGLKPSVLNHRLNGRLDITPAIAELMRADNLLVEEPE